jgi:hypothetical protein
MLVPTSLGPKCELLSGRVSLQETGISGSSLDLARSDKPTPDYVTRESHCRCLLRLGRWGKKIVG